MLMIRFIIAFLIGFGVGRILKYGIKKVIKEY